MTNRTQRAAKALAVNCERASRVSGWLLLLSLPLAGIGCKKTEVAAAPAPEDAGKAAALPHFSFFVTSLEAMQRESGDPRGFGGDLRFGETGEGAGLRGADKLCTKIAETSLEGAGAKTWRAFLSATRGPDGKPVHAIDRIGEGPWYDRVGRLVSTTKAELLQTRPGGAHDDIKNDLPNEIGTPNHNPDGKGEVDNHDVLTGSNDKGQLFMDDPHFTCNDWTNAVPDAADSPRVGHSWPRTFGGFPGGGFFPGVEDADAGTDDDGGVEGGGFRGRGRGGFPPPPPGGFPGGFPGGPPGEAGTAGAGGGFPGFPGGVGAFDPANWMSSLNEAGCGAGAFVIEMGPPWESNPTVGSGGGYGGIYCFALTP